MNIEYPVPEQIPRLRALWKAAFGDEDEFLDTFFAVAYAPERCRCIEVDGKMAAALYWFEDRCCDRKFAYIYAVATDPAFWGRGLCRMLMADTARILAEQGYHGALLHPADEGLVRMYEKMGYAACTTVMEFQCDAGAEAAEVRRLDMEEFARLRRTFLPPGGVLQEKEDLALLDSQAAFYTGEHFLAAVTADGDRLHCHELLGDADAAPGIVAALGKKSGFFRIPGGDQSFAYLLALEENCIRPKYFGFVLD